MDGRLLFIHESALFTLTLRNGQITRLVKPTEGTQVVSARWAPDGERVAYALYEFQDRKSPRSNIFVASADGSGARRVVGSDEGGTFYGAPIWSQDGRQLYVQHTSDAAAAPIQRIERVDLADGATETISSEVGQFDVSRDGRWLALIRSTGGYPSMWLADLQTRETRELVPTGEFEVISNPRFDPKSETLVFSGARWGTGAWSIPGSPNVALASFGNMLLHGPPQDLFSMKVATGDWDELAQIGADEPIAAWSPTGENLAVLSSQWVGILPSAGGQIQELVNPNAYGTLDWSP